MVTKNNYKFFSFVLIFLSLLSFFLGFHLDENSAGGGSYLGDWSFLWPNLKLFINNDLYTAITHENFISNRPPLLYMMHASLNPFVENVIAYRRSVFIISLSVPVLFYFCLKQKFNNKDNLLLILIASTIFLSPYFRTSSYWGLEENYGIISLLLTFLFLNFFLKNKNEYGYKIYFQLFLLIFFSSLCIYFDQKLLIIPIICFLSIITSKKIIKLKLFSICFYFILSLPYIYLIILWGGIFPETLTSARNLGDKLYLDHIGYTSTIIAFYFVPFLLFKEKDLFTEIKNFFLKKNNYYLILLFCIYILYLLVLSNFLGQNALNIDVSTGKGFIHKSSLILFKNNFIIREIFIYFSFLISWVIVLIFIGKSFKNGLILLYFFLASVLTQPLMQEYFDPLIFIMIFTFFSSKLFITYKNVIILFFYFSIFLVGSNIYYYNLLN